MNDLEERSHRGRGRCDDPKERRYGEVVIRERELFKLLFAALQFTDAKEQSNELRQLLRAASTRSVGIFPDNMSDITEVVVGAKRHLYILTLRSKDMLHVSAEIKTQISVKEL